jgi:uncharacterized protein YsxB (DUF464 family)
MIRAAFDPCGDKLRLCVTGHAEYSESGSDIVCAAISGMFYSFLGYLIARHREQMEIARIEHGYAELYCPLCAEENLKQTCIGFLQIENTYPHCVKVNNNLWIDGFEE